MAARFGARLGPLEVPSTEAKDKKKTQRAAGCYALSAWGRPLLLRRRRRKRGLLRIVYARGAIPNEVGPGGGGGREPFNPCLILCCDVNYCRRCWFGAGVVRAGRVWYECCRRCLVLLREGSELLM